MAQIRDAFDATVDACPLDPVDAALVEAGRTIADRVDAAVASGEGPEVTKALYLVPHLVNVLREMQATPAARKAAAKVDGPDKPQASPLASVQSMVKGLQVVR